MKLLLDTHVLLWWLGGDPRLGDEACESIATARQVWVSSASIWEAEIKSALGRLRLPGSLSVEVLANGFLELPISFHHAEAAGRLPRHYRDPFDRMLAAQTRAEDLVLVTKDPIFEAYGIAHRSA